MSFVPVMRAPARPPRRSGCWFEQHEFAEPLRIELHELDADDVVGGGSDPVESFRLGPNEVLAEQLHQQRDGFRQRRRDLFGLPPEYGAAVAGSAREQGDAGELFVGGKGRRDQRTFAVTDDDNAVGIDLRSGSECLERSASVTDVVVEAGGEVVPLALADATFVVAK